MHAVHTRISQRLREGQINAAEVLRDASALAVETIPFVVTRHNEKDYLTIDLVGRDEPVTLGITRNDKAELRPFPPLAGSSTTYDFEYFLQYRSPGHPLMAIRTIRPGATRLYVVLGDSEQQPLQVVRFAPGEPVDNRIWFPISIDQFNLPTLQDFVQNSLTGRQMCATKDYQFASIFENCEELAREACASKNNAEIHEDESKHNTNREDVRAEAGVEKSKKTVRFSDEVFSKPQNAVEPRKKETKGEQGQVEQGQMNETTETEKSQKEEEENSSSEPATAPSRTQENTEAQGKSFMAKYWYLFVIGGVALIIIIIGVYMVVVAKKRKKQSELDLIGTVSDGRNHPGKPNAQDLVGNDSRTLENVPAFLANYDGRRANKKDHGLAPFREGAVPKLDPSIFPANRPVLNQEQPISGDDLFVSM